MREGFEKAFVHVLLPLMQRTGVLWVSGSVKPAQEHFISNLIRRKLCVAVDNIFHDKEKPSKKFLLFLPEGETHELLLVVYRIYSAEEQSSGGLHRFLTCLPMIFLLCIASLSLMCC
jgi:hypothetical protein